MFERERGLKIKKNMCGCVYSLTSTNILPSCYSKIQRIRNNIPPIQTERSEEGGEEGLVERERREERGERREERGEREREREL